MNWARYKVLIISGVLTLLACGGLVFWLISSSSTQKELETKVQTMQRNQTRLTKMELYPSKANLEALLAEQIKVRERHTALLEAIADEQIQVRPISRSRFGDYVKDAVPELQDQAAQATKGGESGVVLRDPEFGLTPYLEGTLPTQNEINRLVVEIETMKHLAGLLFDSGISELVSIAAVVEEEEEVEAPNTFAMNARAGRDRRGRRGEASAEEQAPEVTFETERDRMFESVTFEMEFKVYEDFFWQTLNALLADENQIVISSLAITNSNTILWPDYLQTVGEGTERQRRRRRTATPQNDNMPLFAGGEEAEATEVAPEVKLPGLLERRKHVVGGDLLDVVLKLNVYRMKPKVAAAGEGA